MKKTLLIALTLTTTVTIASTSTVDPEQSRQLLVDYFKKKHPDIKFENYKLGAYNYSADKYSQWEAVEDFPPYLDAIDIGEELYYKDQDIYEKCFGNDIEQVRVKYPLFNNTTNQVETLENEINKCRTKAGLQPFGWEKGKLAQLSAFYAYNSRDKKINVQIISEGAKKAFLDGQQFYTQPRGQFNLSCAKCHTYNSGKKARANLLSPNIGHTSHFPVFRGKWQNLGTLHRRYRGCQKNMRATPFKPQSETYRNLEFFQAYMSNGIEIDGPGYRE